MNFRALIDELKRRRVVRVAGVYIVVAFAVIQAADLMLPRLGLPDWTVTLVIVLALLGFPVAAALAWALDVTPSGIQRVETGPAADAGVQRNLPRYALALLVLLVVSAAAWYAVARDGSGDDVALDPDLLAVMPFRVQGADASLAYLHEGMMDLLAAKLTATPRAVDVRAVIGAYRRRVGDAAPTMEDAAGVAGHLGAARFVVGGIVGAPSHVTVSASLYETSSGRKLADANVAGHADSLAGVVDRLVATLLSRELREAEHRLSALTSTSFTAVRAYLEGKALYRRGRYDEAAERLSAALDIDSTFALAGLGLAEAATMLVVDPGYLVRGTETAWLFRNRLSPADQAYLQARRGPRYPLLSTERETIDMWEQLTRAQPDRAEVWYEYADQLQHFGAFVGMLDHFERADVGFRRALELDPEFYPALQHILFSALVRQDTQTARRLSAEYLAHDSVGLSADLTRWTLSVSLHDTLQIRRLADEASTMNYDVLFAMAGPQIMRGLPDYDRLSADLRSVARSRARSSMERSLIDRGEWSDALTMGRPDRAAQLMERVVAASGSSAEQLAHVVVAGLYWDGDREYAARAAPLLSAKLGTLQPDARAATVWQHCILAQWQIWNEQTPQARATEVRMRSIEAARPEESAGWSARTCAALLAAGIAAADGATDAQAKAVSLDSLLLQGPPVGTRMRILSNFAAGRILELTGDTDRALGAMQRSNFGFDMELLLGPRLRETGRLAEITGDTDLAITSYRRFLTLREIAEPAATAQDDAVRNALARLTGESAARR